MYTWFSYMTVFAVPCKTLLPFVSKCILLIWCNSVLLVGQKKGELSEKLDWYLTVIYSSLLWNHRTSRVTLLGPDKPFSCFYYDSSSSNSRLFQGGVRRCLVVCSGTYHNSASALNITHWLYALLNLILTLALQCNLCFVFLKSLKNARLPQTSPVNIPDERATLDKRNV